jgi:hypothetical protein
VIFLEVLLDIFSPEICIFLRSPKVAKIAPLLFPRMPLCLSVCSSSTTAELFVIKIHTMEFFKSFVVLKFWLSSNDGNGLFT